MKQAVLKNGVSYSYFQWTEDGQDFQIQHLTLDT